MISKSIRDLINCLSDSSEPFSEECMNLVYEHRLVFRLSGDVLESQSKIKSWLQAQTLVSQMQFAAWKDIITAMTANNLHLLSFKGPVLSQWLYTSPIQRQFGDLDFLLELSQIPKAERVLQELGYEIRDYSKAFPRKYLIRYSNVLVYKHKVTKVEVELHWKCFPPSFSLWNKAISSKSFSEIYIDGVLSRTMKEQDLFLYLLLHGHKHQWFRLGWLYDFHLMVHKIGLDQSKKYAQQAGLYKMFSSTVDLYDCIWNKRKMKVGAMTQHYISILNQGAFPPDQRSYKYYYWKWWAMDSVLDNLKHAVYSVLTPDLIDYKIVKLPLGFYPFVKPFLYFFRLLSNKQ